MSFIIISDPGEIPPRGSSSDIGNVHETTLEGVSRPARTVQDSTLNLKDLIHFSRSLELKSPVRKEDDQKISSSSMRHRRSQSTPPSRGSEPHLQRRIAEEQVRPLGMQNLSPPPTDSALPAPELEYFIHLSRFPHRFVAVVLSKALSAVQAGNGDLLLLELLEGEHDELLRRWAATLRMDSSTKALITVDSLLTAWATKLKARGLWPEAQVFRPSTEVKVRDPEVDPLSKNACQCRECGNGSGSDNATSSTNTQAQGSAEGHSPAPAANQPNQVLRPGKQEFFRRPAVSGSATWENQPLPLNPITPNYASASIWSASVQPDQYQYWGPYYPFPAPWQQTWGNVSGFVPPEYHNRVPNGNGNAFPLNGGGNRRRGWRRRGQHPGRRGDAARNGANRVTQSSTSRAVVTSGGANGAGNGIHGQEGAGNGNGGNGAPANGQGGTKRKRRRRRRRRRGGNRQETAEQGEAEGSSS